MCTLLSVGESAYDTFFGDPAFAQKILSNAIDYKTHDHRVKGEILMYRLYFCMKTWWMRNFPVSVSGGDDEEDDIGEKELRNILLWSQDDDSEWIDRAGVPFLMYPVIQKNVRALQESLEHLQNAVSKVKRERILRSKVKYSGSSEFKALTGNNILHIAMCLSSPEIVCLLLENGIDPDSKNSHGMDSFMSSCVTNNISNAKFWYVVLFLCHSHTVTIFHHPTKHYY